jgi:hypothetical protein
MAKVPFIVDIDLNKNQLLNAAIQNLAIPPANAVEGQIYYNTADHTPYVYASSNESSNPDGWLDLGLLYKHPTVPALNPTLSTNRVLAALTTNSLGQVTAASTRLLTLADLGFTGSPTANNYVHPTYTSRDSGTLNGISVISRVASDTNGHLTAVTTRNITNADINSIILNDALASSTTYGWSINKIKSFVASAITGQMVYVGGYSASALPPTGSGVIQGYTYTVTVGGNGAGFFANQLQVGDMIIAEKNNPAVDADWTQVNKNIPDIVNSSETERGIIEIATQVETNAGTDDLKAVTPKKLKSTLNSFAGSLSHSQTFGDGTATNFAITHNLDSSDVLVSVVQLSSGLRTEMQVVITSSNVVTLSTNKAPSSNFYRVTIKK